MQGGQVHWTKSGTEDGVLLGRSEQVDTALGISSNYACVNCCNDSARNGRVVENNAARDVDDTYTFIARDDLQDCYGGSIPQDIDAAEWSTSDEGIATVSVGMATGIGAGTATITARWYDIYYVYTPNNIGGEFGGSYECDGRVQHFVKTATFKVRVPTSISVSFGPLRTHLGQPITTCEGTELEPFAWGYSRLLTYTVLDQDGNPFKHSGYEATESVYPFSCHPSDACDEVHITTPVNPANGTFCDVQALFSRSSNTQPAPGDYIKARQLLNITNSGHLWSLRLNCIDLEYDDVSVVEVPLDATCQ